MAELTHSINETWLEFFEDQTKLISSSLCESPPAGGRCHLGCWDLGEG